MVDRRRAGRTAGRPAPRRPIRGRSAARSRPRRSRRHEAGRRRAPSPAPGPPAISPRKNAPIIAEVTDATGTPTPMARPAVAAFAREPSAAEVRPAPSRASPGRLISAMADPGDGLGVGEPRRRQRCRERGEQHERTEDDGRRQSAPARGPDPREALPGRVRTPVRVPGAHASAAQPVDRHVHRQGREVVGAHRREPSSGGRAFGPGPSPAVRCPGWSIPEIGRRDRCAGHVRGRAPGRRPGRVGRRRGRGSRVDRRRGRRLLLGAAPSASTTFNRGLGLTERPSRSAWPWRSSPHTASAARSRSTRPTSRPGVEPTVRLDVVVGAPAPSSPAASTGLAIRVIASDRRSRRPGWNSSSRPTHRPPEIAALWRAMAPCMRPDAALDPVLGELDGRAWPRLPLRKRTASAGRAGHRSFRPLAATASSER